MRSHETAVVRAAFFGYLLIANVRVAAECPTPPIEQAFDTSDAVCVGRAASQRVLRTNSIAGLETEITFDVEQLWKGSPENGQVQIHACGGAIDGTAVTCGESFRFTVGERYVVFAAGRPLTTNVCQPTRQV